MRRISILTFLTALLATLGASAAPTAHQILAGVRKAMFAKPSVEIMFTLTSDGASTQGSAVMQDAMFTFATPQFLAWYDGSTQWAFQLSTEEVNISEPTAEEVMALNPFGILGDAHKYYNVSVSKSAPGMASVKLTPKAKGTGILSITVDTDAAKYIPRAIHIAFDDGRSMTLTIDRLTPGNRLPANNFRYDSKRYPAREIIDLR